MPLKSSISSHDIISSHVRISYRFYEFVTTRYTTDFYIIKYFTWLGKRQGTKKSCRGIEQVREARKQKVKPFLLENDTEIIV